MVVEDAVLIVRLCDNRSGWCVITVLPAQSEKNFFNDFEDVTYGMG